MSFEVFDYIDKKKAGMVIVCNGIAKGLESQAKANAKWKDTSDDGKVKNTANARQGITSGVTSSNGNYSIYLAHGVDYGAILEEGSKPHVITPKNGKALYWKGATHPVKKVNHPGTKGFHTFEKTLEQNKEAIISKIIEYWSD